MSTITKLWTENQVRAIIRKLDEKTGLNGAALPIKFTCRGNILGCYHSGKKYFRFHLQFMNEPSTKESEVIDLIRHEYAHYYVDKTNLGRYVKHSLRETVHGDDWKWACKMVGADPTRLHKAIRFKDKNWTTEEAVAAHNANDLNEFDVVSFLDKWNLIPIDESIAIKALARIKERDPDTYYEVGNKVLHPHRGFGIVEDTIPFSYWTQKILVRFEDQTEGVFESKDLCKIVDGVAIPFQTKSL